MQAYFTEKNLPMIKSLRIILLCEKIFIEGSPQITFPSNNAEYLISKKNPEPLQLTCSVAE